MNTVRGAARPDRFDRVELRARAHESRLDSSTVLLVDGTEQRLGKIAWTAGVAERRVRELRDAIAAAA